MLINRRVITVFNREIKDKLLSKSFIIMTLLVPVFLFGILAFQTFVMTFEGKEKVNIHVISSNDKITSEISNIFNDPKFTEDRYTFKALTIPKDSVAKYLEANKSNILEEKITGIIFLPDSVMSNKEIKYYSKNPNNLKLFDKVRSKINNVILSEYFKDKNLSKAQLEFALKNVNFNPYRITKEQDIRKEGYGNTVVAFLFSFLLYFSLIMIGTQMMRSVIEEKTNRIVEVLLSSVSSLDLLTGKILGTAVTGLIQMAIWLIPVFVVISTSIFVLPEDFILSISIGTLLAFLLNYFIGLVTFLGLFAAVGSIFDNDQDAQQGIWPLMMLIMIPFFIAMGIVSNPENSIARITSFVPFGSIIVMPTRAASADVPVFQIIIANIINLITMGAVFVLAAKIYKTGLLFTGKKPKWSEVAKWLKS
ncbi:MAG: ABC transporter permease [Bacteroidota bacterium]|nr:ABC transporter permease [Bacteroidota bacterium]